MEPKEVIARALEAANERLGTDVAFVAQFVENKRVYRFASGDLEGFGVRIGETHVEGKGFSVSAAVRFPNGEVYGNLWAAKQKADRVFGTHEIEFLALIANLIAEQIERDETHSAQRKVLRERATAALEDGALVMMFQPIVDLNTGEWKGVESLARFQIEPKRTPDVWFKDAWACGLGEELELSAVRKALADILTLPEGMYMSINVSPETLIKRDVLAELQGYPIERIVVEVTEHAVVPDYDEMKRAFAPLRAHGARLAIDDAGSGYSSMMHILKLEPDIIKLDGSLTANIDTDPARQALTMAMVTFAQKIGARIVAEVVETAEAVAALRDLAVHTGQGWFWSKPRLASEIRAEAPVVKT